MTNMTMTNMTMTNIAMRIISRAPWWAAASAAIGLFLYQTLDAIDGKQAR